MFSSVGDFWAKTKVAVITPKYSIRNVIFAMIFGIFLGVTTLSIFYGPSKAFGILGELFSQDFSSTANGFAMMLNQFVILGFAGLAVMIGMKAGILNIGVSGQMTFGGFLSYAVLNRIASSANSVNGFTIILLGLVITIAGAVFLAVIAGFLKAFFKVNAVISTILLNWVIVYFLRFIVQHLAVTGKNLWFHTNDSQSVLNLDPKVNLFTSFFGNNVWPIALFGIVLFLMAVVVLWFIISKTTLGFKMASVGDSERASIYAGYNAKKNTIVAFAISGVLAGFAGFVMFFIANNQIPVKTQPIQEGFLGIVVALVGMTNPIGILFSGLLFGLLIGPVGGVVTLIPGIAPNATLIFSGTISYTVAIATLWLYFRPILITQDVFQKIKQRNFNKNKLSEEVK